MKCSLILLLCVICWQLSLVSCDQKIKSARRTAGHKHAPTGARRSHHHHEHHKPARRSSKGHHTSRRSHGGVKDVNRPVNNKRTLDKVISADLIQLNTPKEATRRSMPRIPRSVLQDQAPPSTNTSSDTAASLIQILDNIWTEVHQTLDEYLATVNSSKLESDNSTIVIGLNSTGETDPEPTRRLIGGRYATLEEYPYVVSILKNKEHWCTGSLISHRVVVTSANCFLKPDPTMEVRVGTRNSVFGGHLVSIMSVISHPKWTRMKEPSPDYDVALLLLDRTIKFSDDLHTVQLPPKKLMPPFNDAWVASFGTRNPDGKYDILDGNLEVYRANLTDMEKCKNTTRFYHTRVTGNHICLSQADHKAPCTRDTGAPAVSDGYLWGIASWGIRKTCGAILLPAMFSYLGAADNADFIQKSLEEMNKKFPYTEK